MTQAPSKKDGDGECGILILFLIVLSLILIVGLIAAKTIYHFSRSILLTLTWLVFHFGGFFGFGLLAAQGEGDQRVSGWERMRILLDFQDLWLVYAGGIITFFTLTLLVSVRHSKEVWAEIWAAEEEDRRRPSGLAGLLVLMGAGLLGFEAGRKVGRGS